ncbi:hypothetical protein [Parasitella parasitica]|uniref:Uncharacterized protein n=1 Tax=Parasitella parasitica TaxID=35722 RepID=A0A0B7MXA7_9FUNG|nr:hypothetical protein [Parasitella parasitica]
MQIKYIALSFLLAALASEASVIKTSHTHMRARNTGSGILNGLKSENVINHASVKVASKKRAVLSRRRATRAVRRSENEPDEEEVDENEPEENEPNENENEPDENEPEENENEADENEPNENENEPDEEEADENEVNESSSSQALRR